MTDDATRAIGLIGALNAATFGDNAKREELAQAEEHLAETWREFDLVNCRLSMAMARVDDARAALGMARRESDR